MKKFRVLSLAALLAASTGAAAADFSYDYLEGSFGEYDDADVLYLGGAMGLNEQLGLLGAIGTIDSNGFDVTVLRGGGLFHTAINPDLDFFGTLEVLYTSWDTPAWSNADDNDIGFAASGGIRYAVQDNFQLEGKLTVVEVDPFDDGLGLSAGARYYLNKQLSAAAGVASDAEFDGIWINLRYDLK